MSVQASTWAWEQKVTPGAKLVLLALADVADGYGECYPGQKRLARMTCMGERTVRRHIAEMEKAGVLESTERRRRDGSRTSDLYQLRMPGAPAANVAGSGAGATGQNRQTNRPKSTESPAILAGHELPVELPVEPPVEDLTPPTPPMKAEGENEAKAKPKSAAPFDPSRADLPDGLDPQAWADFVQHRREKRKPLTETNTRVLLRELGTLFTADEANDRLRRAVANGWQGVVFPEDRSRGAARPALVDEPVKYEELTGADMMAIFASERARNGGRVT